MQYKPNPIIKTCAFCGDVFESHHGLQVYCPEKYGRRNYCKNEQKKLVNERKLAELVQDVSSAINQVELVNNQLNKNIEILDSILNNSSCIEVSSKSLDNKGYDVRVYSNKKINEVSGNIELLIGLFILEWIDNTGEELIFKLYKS